MSLQNRSSPVQDAAVLVRTLCSFGSTPAARASAAASLGRLPDGGQVEVRYVHGVLGMGTF